MKKIWQDAYFRAALLAAPLFWVILFAVAPSPIHWTWPLSYPLKFLLLGLAYPVLEETVFRGLLQGTFYTHGFDRYLLPGISTANLVSSILFAFSHFLYHNWQWSLAVFAPSLIFGYFLDSYKSIKPSIVLHAFFNSGYYWLFRPF